MWRAFRISGKTSSGRSIAESLNVAALLLRCIKTGQSCNFYDSLQDIVDCIQKMNYGFAVFGYYLLNKSSLLLLLTSAVALESLVIWVTFPTFFNFILAQVVPLFSPVSLKYCLKD